ncbi:MAG: hypothetical protein ABIC95_04310 [archaeon]
MEKTKIVGVLVLIMLLSVVAVYAHETDRSDEGMTLFEDMDSIHEEMTSGLDPELKAQMDLIHEGCQGDMERVRNQGGWNQV